MPTDFTKTRTALEIYDADRTAREEAFLKTDSNEAVDAWLRLEEEARHQVSEAFADDTKHINTREQAFLVHPDDPWLRNTVRAQSRKPVDTRTLLRRGIGWASIGMTIHSAIEARMRCAGALSSEQLLAIQTKEQA